MIHVHDVFPESPREDAQAVPVSIAFEEFQFLACDFFYRAEQVPRVLRPLYHAHGCLSWRLSSAEHRGEHHGFQ